MYATRRATDYKEMMVAIRLKEAQGYVEMLENRKTELQDTHRRLKQEERIGRDLDITLLRQSGVEKGTPLVQRCMARRWVIKRLRTTWPLAGSSREL